MARQRSGDLCAHKANSGDDVPHRWVLAELTSVTALHCSARSPASPPIGS